MKRQLLLSFVSALVVLVWGLVSPVSADLEAGLLAHFDFEGDGDVLMDVTGNGNDGSIGSAERSDDGYQGGRCLRFADPDRKASIPGAGLLVTNAFTVAIWVNQESFDPEGENRLIYKDGQYNFDLLNGGGRLEIRAEGNWHGTAPAEPLSVNEWHLVVATLDGQVSTHYIDGEVVGGNSGIPGPIQQTESSILLGNIGPKSFVGCMDNLRIYNRALSADEVSSLLLGSDGEAVSPEGSLVTTWATIKHAP
jgi:hypothetical protein